MNLDDDQDVTMANVGDQTAEQLLESWSSPKLGTVRTRVRPMDPQEWLEQDDDDEDGDLQDNHYESPKRSVLQRANTPVMSNSSSSQKQKKKKKHHPNILSTASVRPFALLAPPTLAVRPHSSQDASTFTLYHDATTSFLQSKRQGDDPKNDGHYLEALKQMSWDRGDVVEGNFWLLLSRLLSINALYGEEDKPSLQLRERTVHGHMERLSQTMVHSSPAAVMQEFYNIESAPRSLCRLYTIREWLHSIHANSMRPARKTRTHVKMVSNERLEAQGLFETDQDGDICQTCLDLILAGQLSDALQVAKDSRVGWRAAVWGGGAPHGHTRDDNVDTYTSYGNEKRAIWKHVLFQYSDSGKIQDDSELAIVALLSGNLLQCLNNSKLRTNYLGWYSLVNAVLNRYEDELLHMHNNHRRLARPPFPGTQYAESEQKLLMAMSNTLELNNEHDFLAVLNKSPFDEFKQQNLSLVMKFTNAVLCGKSELYNTLSDVMEESTNDPIAFRFLVHLAVFLDSHTVGRHANVALSNIGSIKDELLLQYLDFLASRPELWNNLVLYASLLPDKTMEDVLPRLLVFIESDTERATIVGQLDELLTTSRDAPLKVLRQTVQLVHERNDNEMVSDETTTNDHISQADLGKMRATLWLKIKEAHYHQALVAANDLLRQFLQQNKFAASIAFVTDVFGSTGILHHESIADDDEVRSEHEAYLNLLDATKLFERWKATLEGTDRGTTMGSDPSIDTSRLNDFELQIAQDQERRHKLDAKQQATRTLLEAAEATDAALLAVLEHPGGWLVTTTVRSESDAKRQSELTTLRKTLVPKIVQQYFELCERTADWCFESLEDALEHFDSLQEAVHKIGLIEYDSEQDALVQSSLSPRFWTHRALQLSFLVEDESHPVQSAFGLLEDQWLAIQLAKVTETDMWYETELI